ncbi:MAG: branched-chain amino acid ABC transporter permease, partial [Thermoleophilaceae bacterium]
MEASGATRRLPLGRARARPNRGLTRRYEDELRLFRTRSAQAGLAALIAVWALLPVMVTDDFWLSVLNYAGITAIGAIGLNLLTGYTGQVSLGHAFFLGVGAYAAAQLGGELDLPLVLWLPGAALVGALIGAAVGPFALRLRGNYLVIVTLGLVFLGEHLFRNLDSVTGGNSGTSVVAPVS